MKSFKEFCETDLHEVDSLQTRMKKRASFRKNKNKILRARKKAAKRVIIDPAKLMKRARKQARNILIKNGTSVK